MKILFRTMRYNWRYIFSKSNKIAVALFSVWGGCYISYTYRYYVKLY